MKLNKLVEFTISPRYVNDVVKIIGDQYLYDIEKDQYGLNRITVYDKIQFSMINHIIETNNFRERKSFYNNPYKI